MRPQLRLLLVMVGFLAFACIVASIGEAQPAGKKGGKGSNETVDEFVIKLMAFNKAKDGKLTKTELFDTRLHALFDRADTKKNGYVTRAELEVLFAREKLEGGGLGSDKKGKGGDKKGKGGF